jgi:LPS export ABC transporter permease LptG/LPS export ABC transporter permease LptF
VRILTRYILNEVLSHAAIGGAIFTFVLFIRYLPHLLEMIVRNSASLGSVLTIVLMTLPDMFTVTIPMVVLVGILLGLSRLAADSEVTAMRASGIGVWSFVRIVGVIAVAGWAISLWNSMYLAPKAAAAMIRLENSLANAQASYEVQPRVFYEDFRNYVLYVQDVRAGSGAANWRGIFLADVTDPRAPKITTADRATVVNGPNQTMTMRLRDGTESQTVAGQPNQYTVSTFGQTDLPLESGAQEDVRLGRSDTPILAMTSQQLLARTHGRNGRVYEIEFQKRLAYPAACLVLMLVGVPLGISSRRGGKGAGFVLTIALVFVYYFLSSTGTALARQHKIPAFLGVWQANLIFAVCGIVLLRQMATGGAALSALTSLGNWFRLRAEETTASAEPVRTTTRTRARGRFPLILDEYVLREFVLTFVLVLVTFVMLMLIFTFFELLSDIIRNRTPLITVGEYLVNLTPSMIYLITPLSVLIGVLVVFGIMNRNSELTAMKATGVSLYRITVPVVAIAAVLSVSLFIFDELYLPQANRRQEALRNVIKGKPAETFEHPGRKWIFGQQRPGQPSRIFYYEYFDSDPDHDAFGNISVFEFNPGSFNISRRIFASAAHWEPKLNTWVFEEGWERTFSGSEITSYEDFPVKTFSEISEEPAYFKKEVRQSSEMNFGELADYIHDLRQSGFNTVPLRVQLNHKLAYPLITLVMAVLAIPFALSMGKRGSLSGIAIAIGVAITYFVVSGFFEAMGNVSWLPAFLAAWSPDLLFGLAGAWLLLRTPT